MKYATSGSLYDFHVHTASTGMLRNRMDLSTCMLGRLTQGPFTTAFELQAAYGL